MAFPTGYTLYQNITIDNTKVPSIQSNFPVYIDLSDLVKAGSDIFDTCRSDGGDIRVTLSDGTTQLPREVVLIDTGAKTGELHVKIPSLLSASATIIRIWYNGTDTEPAINSTYGAENTWNSNYELVYHMDDETTSTVLDSTSNDNDGAKDSANNPIEIAGKIGQAQDFDSTNKITVSANATLRDLPTTYDFTVSIWFNSDLIESAAAALSWSGTDDLVIYPNSGTGGTGTRVFWRDVGGNMIVETGSDLSGTYYLLHFISRASNDHEAFRNAVSFATSVDTGSAGPFTDVFVGDFVGQNFDGKIDEVRILSTALSDDWLTTEYNNQSSTSTFYSVSDEIGGITTTSTTTTTTTQSGTTTTTLPLQLIHSTYIVV